MQSTSPLHIALLAGLVAAMQIATPVWSQDDSALAREVSQGETGSLSAPAADEIPVSAETPASPAAPAEAEAPCAHAEAAPPPEGMVLIHAGTFTMGSPLSDQERIEDEEAQYTVTLTRNFWMSRTEVTQAEYEALMGTNPARFSSCGPTCPVDNVAWLNAAAYANARSAAEGFAACYTFDAEGEVVATAGTIYDCAGYRLPTEAEWEYAARAGTTDVRYGELDDIAWTYSNAGISTLPVCGRAPNAWGLCDMFGNVAEWCHDAFAEYPVGAATDPVAEAGIGRVFRGGAWLDYGYDARAAGRRYSGPWNAEDSFGIRLVRTAR